MNGMIFKMNEKTESDLSLIVEILKQKRSSNGEEELAVPEEELKANINK